ncbi:MAG TPA: hypothetical protein VME22_29595 [Solirubrobacteraceae bacterium]|nr:hypothetical protein [Solirubrobacteraceae bacterium]
MKLAHITAHNDATVITVADADDSIESVPVVVLTIEKKGQPVARAYVSATKARQLAGALEHAARSVEMANEAKEAA